MFRAAFHTGYSDVAAGEQGVLRMTKAELDGACSDKRFHEEVRIRIGEP